MHLRTALVHAAAVILLVTPTLSDAASLTIEDPAFASLVSGQVPNSVVLAGSLPAFDGSLGTLTGVSIRTIGQGSAFLMLDAPEAGFYTGPLRVAISLLDAGQSVLGTAVDNMGAMVGEATSAGPVLLQDGNAFATTLDISSALGAFLLGGVHAIELSFFGTVSGPGLSAQPYLADSFMGSIVVDRVTFTYTEAMPIPEPSSALLVGMGLAALGMRRLRTSI